MLTFKQQQLEADFLNNSYNKALQEFHKNVQQGKEYNTTAGLLAVHQIIEAVETMLEQMLTEKHYMNKFWKDILHPLVVNKTERSGKLLTRSMAEMVALNIVSSISVERPLTSIAANMADACFIVFNIEQHSREQYRDYARKFFLGTCQDLVEKNNVGLYTIEGIEGNDDTKILKPTSVWNESLEEAGKKVTSKMSPNMPMIVKPLPHTSLTTHQGGYCTLASPLLNKVIKVGDKVHESITSFTSKTNPDFFSMINAKQEVAYQVNSKLLKVIEFYYNCDGKKKVDPKRPSLCFAKFPMKPVQIKDQTEKDIQESLAALERQYSEVWDSEKNKVGKVAKLKAKEKCRKTMTILNMANEYKEYHQLFFPVYVDFRGRVYTYVHTGSLSYMGGELAKSLLVLADKEAFTEDGISGLFQTLGNALDFGKKSKKRKERLAREWYAEHKELFKAGHLDMFFDHSAPFDEPINALAIVLELMEWEKDPTYKSGIICHSDARCSGTAIIGTLLGDKQAMSLTSVFDEVMDADDDLPDAYTFVAQRGRELNTIPYFEANADDVFSRSVWKTPVMTRGSYGATRYTVREHNVTKFSELGLDVKRVGHFTNLMMETLDSSIPSCSLYLDGAKEAAKKQIEEKGHIAYSVPFTGFPFFHYLYEEVISRLESPVKYQRIQLVMKKFTKKMDKAGMLTAISPCLIHSLDAMLLLFTQSKCDFTLTCVHDSVGCHPNNMKKVVQAYAEGMHYLIKQDVLGNIFNQMGSVAPKVNTISKEEVEAVKTSLHVLS